LGNIIVYNGEVRMGSPNFKSTNIIAYNCELWMGSPKFTSEVWMGSPNFNLPQQAEAIFCPVYLLCPTAAGRLAGCGSYGRRAYSRCRSGLVGVSDDHLSLKNCEA